MDIQDICKNYEKYETLYEEVRIQITENNLIEQSRQRKCAYCECDLLESDNKCPGCEEYLGDTIISNDTVQSSSSLRSLMRCVYCNNELSTDDIQCPICDAVIEKVGGNRFQEKWRCEKCAFENDQSVSKCCECEDNDDEDNTTMLTNQLKENDNVNVDEDENTSADALSRICDLKDRSLSGNDVIGAGNTNSGRDEYKDITTWSLVECTCTNLRDAELCPYTRQAYESGVVSTAYDHTFSDDQESINEPRDSNEEITPLEHTVVGNEEDLSPDNFHARRENKLSLLDESENVNLHGSSCLHDSSESGVLSSVNAEFIGSINTDELNDTANEDPSLQSLYYSDDNDGRYDHSWDYKQNEKEFRNSIASNRNCSVKSECAPQCRDNVTARDRDVGNCEYDDEENLRNVCDITKEMCLQDCRENEEYNKCANVVYQTSDSKDLSFAGNDVMNVMNNNENFTEEQISNENYNDTVIGEEAYINGINPEPTSFKESLNENSGKNIFSVDRELPCFHVCGTNFSSSDSDENDGYFGDGGNDSNLNLRKKEKLVVYKDECLSKEFGYNPSKTTITTSSIGVKDDHDGNEVTIESCHTSIPDYEMVDDGYEPISKDDFSIP